jgi:hypothetical protein
MNIPIPEGDRLALERDFSRVKDGRSVSTPLNPAFCCSSSAALAAWRKHEMFRALDARARPARRERVLTPPFSYQATSCRYASAHWLYVIGWRMLDASSSHKPVVVTACVNTSERSVGLRASK